jgi:hypothetical protein
MHIRTQVIKALFLVFALTNIQTSFAIKELNTNDVRSFSLGKIRALSDELLNPANIPFSSRKEGGVSIFNQFQMKELNTATLYLKYPNKWLDTGVKLSTFGYADYRIIQSQFGFAKKFLSNFSVGIHLSYLNESSILEAHSRHYLTSDLGLYFTLNEHVDLALLGENLLHSMDENQLNVSAGLKYKMTEHSLFLLETSSGKEVHFSFSAGLEYEIFNQFTIRSGFKSNPGTPSFGIAYQWHEWIIEAGFSFHTALGTSSMIGIKFLIK